MTSSAGPLFFVHVPKTGGSSLIRTLRGFAPAGQAYTLPGNLLSRAFAEQLAGAALPPSAVIHGHPDWGACSPFRGRARFVTVLREPHRQIVSHYLHAMRDPAMPQHAAAKGLGFKGFLRTYRYNIVFQTHRLYLSITDPVEENRRALADPDHGGAFHLERYFAAQLPQVFTFLEEMALAGTLEARDRFAAILADLAGWSHVPRLPRANAVQPQQRAEIAPLLEQVHELETEPELASLFAIERATYGRAGALLMEAERRRFRSRMQAGSGAAHAVHCSPLGEIALGENFEPQEIAEVWGEQPSAVPRTWRTGGRQVSRIYIRLEGGRSCRLILRLDRLVAVTPSEVLLRQGDRWLQFDAGMGDGGMDGGGMDDGGMAGDGMAGDGMGGAGMGGGGTTILSAVLEASAGGGTAFDEFALYVQWNRYPNEPPFHPWIQVTAFELLPCKAATTGGAGA
jgi:hypothetical protein